jgi:hypothetical protein
MTLTKNLTHEAVVEKLSPNRVKVSGKFTALLAFLLDQSWTEPEITALTITSDGILIDSSSGLANDILGDVGDLERNIRGVAEVAELTAAETRWLLARIPAKCEDHRR